MSTQILIEAETLRSLLGGYGPSWRTAERLLDEHDERERMSSRQAHPRHWCAVCSSEDGPLLGGCGDCRWTGYSQNPCLTCRDEREAVK